MSDRKYRHRGYQDDDRDRDREPQQAPSARRPTVSAAMTTPRGDVVSAPRQRWRSGAPVAARK